MTSESYFDGEIVGVDERGMVQVWSEKQQRILFSNVHVTNLGAATLTRKEVTRINTWISGQEKEQ